MFRIPLIAAFLCVAAGANCADTFLTESDPPELQPVLLQMIRDDAVHEELSLTASQIDQVQSALDLVDGPWFRARIRPRAERITEIGQLTEQLRHSLGSILSADQTKRLNQLENQALGTRMIVRDETADTLEIAAETRQRLYGVFRQTDQVVAETQQKLQSGDLDSDQAAAAVRQAKADELEAIGDTLSNEQKRLLAGMNGSAFDFGQIKRMYPKAPELTDRGASWLQGGPLKLADLKGKVVAVHFYAFQCINCRRNLPHYNGWHADYADQGLVVIGVQTPETSAERSAEKVAAAIETEGIGYPVLMDAQSANWSNWSNTMWPTVYLIDKKGYLRRWWQGEMNWKETPGEQQMRQTIEQLLAEQP